MRGTANKQTKQNTSEFLMSPWRKLRNHSVPESPRETTLLEAGRKAGSERAACERASSSSDSTISAKVRTMVKSGPLSEARRGRLARGAASGAMSWPEETLSSSS